LVLLVEGDGTDEGRSMQPHLASQGCECVVVHDPASTLSVVYETWPDLIIVNARCDIPPLAEICAALDRSNLELPRLVVSENEPYSAVRAHAYLTAPITARRLTNRIKKALGTQAERFIRAGDVCVDALKRNVKCRGNVTHLTPKEVGLLSYLMRHSGQAVSRSEIMRAVWETEYTGDTRTVEVHIRWLRRKIEEDPKRPRRIITVRRHGYLFRPLESRDGAE
jgi:DNA-binding response OmpR family regulator